MTTPRSQTLAALVLSLFITVTIFTGVSSLAAPEQGAQLLAKIGVESTS